MSRSSGRKRRETQGGARVLLRTTEDVEKILDSRTEHPVYIQVKGVVLELSVKLRHRSSHGSHETRGDGEQKKG